jgi:hypothetical protein
MARTLPNPGESDSHSPSKAFKRSNMAAASDFAALAASPAIAHTETSSIPNITNNLRKFILFPPQGYRPDSATKTKTLHRIRQFSEEKINEGRRVRL